MRDLTASEWIRDHHAFTGNPNFPQYLLNGPELDEFLSHFILNHKECNRYSKGLCTHEDAPNPGHSRCIGTWRCTVPERMG